MVNILFVFVSLFAGVFCFFITRNLYFSIAVLLLYLLFFFLYISPKRAKFKRNISRSYEAINFINNFIISLSVSCSLPKALENAKNSGSLNLKLQIESLSHLDVEKQIDYYLDTGMKLEVEKNIEQMKNDGTLNYIINDELLYDINNQVSINTNILKFLFMGYS